MSEPKSPAIHSHTTKNPSSDLPPQKNNPQPKSLSNFLYKTILFAIIIALLPLFPPQTTESNNNSTLLSRSWELLHLLLVGIAISYGLFSRRNADHGLDKDKEKDANFKPHTDSTMLHISSVFDDEDTKTETWSSQYRPSDPVVVESKPLLLPVRSLKKSRVSNSDSSGSVLSSPIPWNLRSGRLELRDEDPAMADASPSSSFYAKACSFSSNMDQDKSFRAASPPPPPPPPPCFGRGHLVSTRREANKSFKDELKDLSKKGREGFLKNTSLDYYSLPRSVRTLKENVAQSTNRAEALQQQEYQAETKKKKKKVEFMEKMIVMMSDDSESEKASDSSDEEKPLNSPLEVKVETQENEVDKKADEFIAKFREQIRLQRIESIKKSSGHRAVKNTK